MGKLLRGVWHDTWYETAQSGGHFVRESAAFNQWVRRDAQAKHPAEAGRYHLYVSYACPWAHRTLIVRQLKGLEQSISVSVVEPLMAEHGWTFVPERAPMGTGDGLFGARYLHEIYTRAVADYTGRVTVPVLWDKQLGTIVSNESADIVRMFNSELASDRGPDLYPEGLRQSIDDLNAEIYAKVNNGVYRAGFATTQAAYEESVAALFATLDTLEVRLAAMPYLCGSQLTEADVRLWTTLARFDAVYVGHFKCNVRRLMDYPNLWRYTRMLHREPAFAETTHLDHIKQHYYRSHKTINPTGVVPVGPQVVF